MLFVFRNIGLLFCAAFLLASVSIAQPGYKGKKVAVLLDLYPNLGIGYTYPSDTIKPFLKLRPGIDFNYTISRSTVIGLSYDITRTGDKQYQMTGHNIEINFLSFPLRSGYVAPVGFFYKWEFGVTIGYAKGREDLIPVPNDPRLTDSLNISPSIGLGFGYQRVIKDAVIFRFGIVGSWMIAHVYQQEKARLWDRLASHRAFNINIGIGVPF